ncbi:PREDICTED: uncharacterized protein LOC109482218 [Branchiostoma belcheri]|uniref:Uncharacterized protein LOC109482218 n=1 Tax=Branchiostoma belcheri TaxID=7741 RepID=A0A6P4ZGW7_BRABE|nr:PREDICTED: uncharacterized protein LOC109482218 [Branchiostoma belcheri]
MPQAQTKLSTIADELRELDLIFKRGSDLDAAERGYAGKLIHAISCENKLLKCEALKSLGDLYLHKAKTNDCRVENFNRACALYQELFRHCRCKEEKQVIQHRLRYAEKCTNLTHSPRRSKLGDSDSDNIILAVSRMLGVVKNEKTKVKGRRLTPVIEAYTQLYVSAVVDRHVRLKMEILKSLGDVYLEKGRVGKEEAAFTKAVGLYRAALDRCEDADARETLKHRIEFAKKVREKILKKQPKETRLTEYRKPGDENLQKSVPTFRQVGHDVISQGNYGGTYQDRLREGSKALQIGDLDRAELNFAAALKTVRVKASSADEHWKEAEPMIKLGDVYLKRGMHSKDGGDFTKAAALCNAALVRAKAEDREGIKQTILEITRSFIRHVLSIEQTVCSGNTKKHKLILKEHRDHVEREIKRIEHQVDPYSLDDADPKIREVEKMRADEIKTLFQTIVEQRRTFIAGLVDECMEVMGPPPCKYAMMGLGSQATGLATPYSDLEFAILVERETQIDVKYFRNLTHYLHIQVINLGETILPAMAIKSLNDFSSGDPLANWFYDSVTPRGLAFDGAMPHACKTPLGRGQTFSLIRTPGSMIKVLLDDVTVHLKKGYHLASILGNVSLISGEQDLVDEYSALWEQQLKKDEGKIPLSIAKTTLSENMESFRRQDLTSAIPVVKAVRYFEQSIKMIRSIYCDGETHPLIADSFHGLGIAWKYIGNYKKATGYYQQSLEMERSIYGKGTSHPCIASSLTSVGGALSDQGDYETAKDYYIQSLEMNQNIYGENTAHPYIAMSLNNLGIIWRKLGDYKKAIGFYEQALQINRSINGENTAHPHIAASLYNLGNVCCCLGDYRKAISYYEQTLQMDREIYGENTTHCHIADTLYALGSAWSDLGEDGKAISCQEQSLQMRRTIFGNTDTLDIAKSLTALGLRLLDLGDHRTALCYFEQSLQIERSIHGKTTAHADIAKSLNNLGMACSDLGDYKKAVSYHDQSLQMKRRIYGKNAAHADIAKSFTNLGIAWKGLRDHRKALTYFEQSLHMERDIYGKITPHPDIARSLGNLGSVWTTLGDHKKAMEYHEQSLKMLQSIFGENTPHADIARSLVCLGTVMQNLGHPVKAIQHFEQSLKMMRSLYGEGSTHPGIAAVLTLLTKAWYELGDVRNAVSYYEQLKKIE